MNNTRQWYNTGNLRSNSTLHREPTNEEFKGEVRIAPKEQLKTKFSITVGSLMKQTTSTY